MRIFIHRLLRYPRAQVQTRDGDATRLRIQGLVCDSVCAARTKRALEALPEVERVQIDFERGEATVYGRPHGDDVYRRAIDRAVAGKRLRRWIERLGGGRGTSPTAREAG